VSGIDALPHRRVGIGARRKIRYQQKYQQNVRLPAIMPEQM
jgi:hypothetical protein